MDAAPVEFSRGFTWLPCGQAVMTHECPILHVLGEEDPCGRPFHISPAVAYLSFLLLS
jgi:hypothetical protein